MYWPVGISRKIHVSPTGLGEDSSQDEIQLTCRTKTASHFLTLTKSTVQIYSVKPIESIAALKRSQRSLSEYGNNLDAEFNPEGDGLIITTDKHFVLIYHFTLPINSKSSTSCYYSYSQPDPNHSTLNGHVRSLSQSLTLSSVNNKKKAGLYNPSQSSLNSTFKSASGEFNNGFQDGNQSAPGRAGRNAATTSSQRVQLAFGIGQIQIQFQVGIRIEGGVGCALPTSTHLLVSTLSPPAIQCIPWPGSNPFVSSSSESSEPQPQAPTRTSLVGRMDWIVGGITTQAKESIQVDDKGKSREKESDENEEVEAESESESEKLKMELEDLSSKEKSSEPYIFAINHSPAISLFFWILSDGRVYATDVRFDSRTAIWKGGCFHGSPQSNTTSSSAFSKKKEREAVKELPEGERATKVAVNAKFSLIAVGREDGLVSLYSILPSSPFPYSDPNSDPSPPEPFTPPTLSHQFSLQESLRSTASHLITGKVTSLQWTGDGHALAVGWEKGWAVWTAWGKYMGGSASAGGEWGMASKNFNDEFMFGVRNLFWGPGNSQLFFLSGRRGGKPFDQDSQLFSLPFAKSAVAGQHSPDNTRYAFVQLDSSLLVYRGAEQPDLSVINPETEAWQHILIPSTYLSTNWPIRYASISSDGRLIAVAGRRGLAHYSASSGKWKTYLNKQQESNFCVRGGLQWFQHVLIAACDADGSYQIRLYSRDAELDNSQLLHIEVLNSPVILSSLFDNSLLVYTEDNTFYHFLIEITSRDIRLTLCGSMSFEGVVGEPLRVRGMSWLVDEQQQKYGDPEDDLTVATIIFLIDGKLVLLRPRKVISNLPAGPNGGDQIEEEEVAYDMQILGDRIEYYWTHLQGIQTLENSLWGYDGKGIKVWLNALKIKADPEDDTNLSAAKARAVENEVKTVRESLNIELDFYPLCVLMEKGIVIGADPEVSLKRNLEFAIFRSNTNTHLFIHQVLRYYLERDQLPTSVLFASHYQHLVYFSHSLEILLHAVLEDEADAQGNESAFKKLNGISQPSRSGHRYTESVIAPHAVLPRVVDFLDHFSQCLEVVVNCARKTELARWSHLFSVVGSPKDLFEKCLASGEFKTAASYLLVIHNLEDIEESTRLTTRLLKKANHHKDFNICKDLLRFLRSMDETGEALRKAVKDSQLLPEDRVEEDLDRVHINGIESSGSQEPYSLTVPPTFTRSSSGTSSNLSDTPEDGETSFNSNSGLSSASNSFNRSRNSSSAWLSSGGSTPPVPEITVTGRILPSRTNSSGSISPVTSRASGNSPQPLRRSSSSSVTSPSSAGPAQPGLGMSLSRVGLRSAERLWDGSGSKNNSSSPNSPGGGSWLGTRSPKSLKEEIEEPQSMEEKNDEVES